MAEMNLRGRVDIITFRNEDSGYTVARVHCSDIPGKSITVVGNFPSVDVGEVGEFFGEWVHDPQFGRQFAARKMDFIVPTTARGIENLLSKGKFKGIGKTYAKKIVQAFGKDTINVIENDPEKLFTVPGIGKKKVAEIIKSWNRKKALKNINLFLAEHDIPLHLAEKIFTFYWENSLQILRTDPYRLATDIKGVGFLKADQIAARIGIEETSPNRIRAALVYILRNAADEGHIYLPLPELMEKGSGHLKLDYDAITQGIARLKNDNRIVEEDGKIFLRFLYSVEVNVAKRVVEILNTPVEDASSASIRAEIGGIEAVSGIVYTEKQKEALKNALSHKIVIITGGPGTGKTTIIRALIKLFERRNIKVRIAAPTGRAAKRMEEACHIPAQTIHRLLDFNPQFGTFNRNISSSLAADAVIIDEVSMIDAPLMAALLSGLDVRTRLILVGDADQLPSVGPGNILRDLLASATVPVVRLDFIFRQEGASDIVVAAHEINNGSVPRIDNSSSTNLFFMKEHDTSRIPGTIADLVKRRLPEKYGFDPMTDVQVLTSMYKGETGANNLNSLLQKTLNPGKKSLQKGERVFIEGDKVMQIRNNYTKDVYNGDIGFIHRIDLSGETVEIHYDSRVVQYAFKELTDIVHAYAITVHKSQGSEYKAVILPLTTQHFIMLQKNLLYTAITRAKHLMIMIGTYKAFNIAVKNNRTAERYTSLAERLRNPRQVETQLTFLESLSDSLSEWY